VAELADALVLGTSVNDVGVQVPSSAPSTEYQGLANLPWYFFCQFADSLK
jgi:hypothetical protein